MFSTDPGIEIDENLASVNAPCLMVFRPFGKTIEEMPENSKAYSEMVVSWLFAWKVTFVISLLENAVQPISFTLAGIVICPAQSSDDEVITFSKIRNLPFKEHATYVTSLAVHLG